VWTRGCQRVEALEGDEWSAARPGSTLPPGKTWYPFYRRLSGPQGWSGRAETLVSTGIRSRIVQPVVSRYIYQSVRWLGYAIHDQGIAIRLPAGERDSPVGCRPAIQWALAPLLKRVKQRQRDWPTNSTYWRGSEWKELHLHSPMFFHCIVFKSTQTQSFPYTVRPPTRVCTGHYCNFERRHPVVHYQISIIHYAPSIHNIHETRCNNYN